MKRVFLFGLLVCAALAQQDMGVITGVVTDATGASVPAARVTATNRETGETRAVDTSDTGAYTVGPLRIGRYDVAVEKDGFKKSIQQDIELHAQDRVRADLKLEVGQMAESISVTAEAPLLQSETSTLAKVVEQNEIRTLPLNGRNFQQLAWLTSGVAPATASRDRESGFNAHGQPMTQNSFLIDGIDNNNNVMGMQDRKMQVVVPSLDAVAEFKVQTSNYSAEFGKNSGAVMIVSIKSGTNQFHGTAYEYLRNDVFDSRDTFNYVDRDRRRQGGPRVAAAEPVRRHVRRAHPAEQDVLLRQLGGPPRTLPADRSWPPCRTPTSATASSRPAWRRSTIRSRSSRFPATRSRGAVSTRPP